MEGDRLTEGFGVTVRRLRQQKQWSQEKFADQCHLHRTYIGSIERGEKTVTIETAAKIATAFGLSLSSLFQYVEDDLKFHDT